MNGRGGNYNLPNLPAVASPTAATPTLVSIAIAAAQGSRRGRAGRRVDWVLPHALHQRGANRIQLYGRICSRLRSSRLLASCMACRRADGEPRARARIGDGVRPARAWCTQYGDT
eukprot:COSAG02_NODE_7711_length_2881_cov_1.801582_3_plen_115_part_00